MAIMIIILLNIMMIILMMMMINTLPAYSGRRRMRLEENIEAREQKPHRWSIEDLSDNDDDCCNYDDHES